MEYKSVYDYYTRRGEQLGSPSDPNRQTLATRAGISNYTGSTKQNINLVNYLNKPTETGANPIFYGEPSATNTEKDAYIDSTLQSMADRNPESADKLMDKLGYTGSPNATYQTPSGATVGADGNLISGPEDTRTAADKAFEGYLSSLKPTAKETDANLYLANLQTQSQLARERALESGETLGFAAGEAQRVGRTFDIKLAGAAGVTKAYAALAANRQNISKARYEYEKAKIDEAAKKEPGFSLGPGQARFDASGKKIASLPPTPKSVDTKDDEPLSTVDIQRIADLYGFTPPFGSTMNEVRKFLADNPGATPQELQNGMDQLARGGQTQAAGEQFLTEDYFKTLDTKTLKGFSDKAGTSRWYTGKTTDVNRFLSELMKKVNEGRASGFSDQAILDYLVEQGIISSPK